ncbi:hypothetical protein Godav_011574 [Gossypium davidsonii]|uniref:Outer envelope pore protein 37, chloroplastic n=1 Tax=Gossypium davidsonii TaxID=34287 RepID=A0A7J8RBQ6_GOSDV|nr:hypothetical protein [Gossypium davidsonii]
MLDASPRIPNYLVPPLLPPPPPSPLEPEPEPPPSSPPPTKPYQFLSSVSSLRVTSEFDSDSRVFFHKLSCKLFDNLAKLKLSFINNAKREITEPQLALSSKYLSIYYDPEEQNAIFQGYYNVGPTWHFKAAIDVKRIFEYRALHLVIVFRAYEIDNGVSEDFAFIKWSSWSSYLSLEDLSEHPCELAAIAKLADPSYAVEVSSPVPNVSLPKATFRFPIGEFSLEEREEDDVPRLSINGIVKGPILYGVGAACYMDEELKLRYSYKDGTMSFIPSISLPTNRASFAFKRRFSPSDKLSYWYNLDSNYWSVVYKHTYDKDLKFKAGYDSEVRLCWASLWVGDENGKAKTAPMKMKVQFMLQVPQDDIKSTVILFRVKKRFQFPSLINSSSGASTQDCISPSLLSQDSDSGSLNQDHFGKSCRTLRKQMTPSSYR